MRKHQMLRENNRASNAACPGVFFVTAAGTTAVSVPCRLKRLNNSIAVDAHGRNARAETPPQGFTSPTLRADERVGQHAVKCPKSRYGNTAQSVAATGEPVWCAWSSLHTFKELRACNTTISRGRSGKAPTPVSCVRVFSGFCLISPIRRTPLTSDPSIQTPVAPAGPPCVV